MVTVTFFDQALPGGLYVRALQKSYRLASQRPFIFFLTFTYSPSRHPTYLSLPPSALRPPPSKCVLARNRKYNFLPSPSKIWQKSKYIQLYRSRQRTCYRKRNRSGNESRTLRIPSGK